MGPKRSHRAAAERKLKRWKVAHHQSVHDDAEPQDGKQQGDEDRHPNSYQNKCAPKKMIEMVNNLVNGGILSEFRNVLRSTGFIGLTKISVDRMDRGIIHNLLQLYDKESKSFCLGEGKLLRVGPDDVKRVYNLPSGNLPIKLSPNRTSRAKQLGADMGLRSTSLAPLQSVYSRILCEKDPEKRTKLFILYSLGCVLNPSPNNRVNLNYADFLHDLELIPKYNWCQHISDTLIGGLDKYADSKDASPLLKGDFHFLFVHFLDSVLFDDEIPSDVVPTCGLWSTELIKNKLRDLKSVEAIYRGRVKYPGTSSCNMGTTVPKSNYRADRESVGAEGLDDGEIDMTLSEATAAHAEAVLATNRWIRRVETLNNYIVRLLRADGKSKDAQCKAEADGLSEGQSERKASYDGCTENTGDCNLAAQSLITLRDGGSSKPPVKYDVEKTGMDGEDGGALSAEREDGVETMILTDSPPKEDVKSIHTSPNMPRLVNKGRCQCSPYVYTGAKRAAKLSGTEIQILEYVRGAVCDDPVSMQVFCDDFNTLTQHDMLTMSDDQWISTNVVNSFVYFLNRHQQTKRVINAIFMPVLMSQASVLKDVSCDDQFFIKRFDSLLKNLCIEADTVQKCKYFVFPALYDSHYVLVVINMVNKQFHWIDTLPQSNLNFKRAKVHVSILLKYVLCWLIHHGIVDKAVFEWKWDICTLFDQGDAVSCGLHCMRMMENYLAVINSRKARHGKSVWSDWTNKDYISYHRARISVILLLQPENSLKEQIIEASSSADVMDAIVVEGAKQTRRSVRNRGGR